MKPPLPFMKETVSYRQRIEEAARKGRPLVLYGMGDGADKLFSLCDRLGAKIAALFASPGFVRHQKFHELTVESYEEVTARLGSDCLILIAFASEKPEVLELFARLEQKHPGGVLAPHLPLYEEKEEFGPAYLARHAEELQETYALLADDRSRAVLSGILDFKLSGKLSCLREVYSRRRQDMEELLHLGPQENYFDLGAYDGDTIKEFLQLTGGSYRHITAAEPDRRNCRRLRAFTEQRRLQNVTILEKGLWCEEALLPFSDTGGRQGSFRTRAKTPVPVTTLDRLSEEHAPTYIKLDVEGAEYETLQGGAAAIKKYRPKLLLAAYHYNDDVFRLPLLLRTLVPGYRFYLRQHPYIPAWESNYFVLPPQ